jgi:hypothetical protein
MGKNWPIKSSDYPRYDDALNLPAESRHGRPWSLHKHKNFEENIGNRDSVMRTPTSTSTSRDIDMLRVDYTQMTSESVVSAESLLLSTQRTVDLLLSGVMYRILVPSEVIRS